MSLFSYHSDGTTVQPGTTNNPRTQFTGRSTAPPLTGTGGDRVTGKRTNLLTTLTVNLTFASNEYNGYCRGHYRYTTTTTTTSVIYVIVCFDISILPLSVLF